MQRVCKRLSKELKSEMAAQHELQNMMIWEETIRSKFSWNAYYRHNI